MSELTDRELIRVRRRFLDILKSFFVEEPDAERMSRWRGFFSALSQERINPMLDSAIRELDELLSTMNLDSIREEYYELFVNPFGDHIVQTTLSYYADGHDFGQSLVDLRSFLINADITKSEGLDQSEDSLVFLLDTLVTLIHDEEQEYDNARKKQAELLTLFLEPFSVHFNSALQQNGKAKFFEACGAFLIGYVDLEKGLLV